jgi:hypothetical protein
MYTAGRVTRRPAHDGRSTLGASATGKRRKPGVKKRLS